MSFSRVADIRTFVCYHRSLRTVAGPFSLHLVNKLQYFKHSSAFITPEIAAPFQGTTHSIGDNVNAFNTFVLLNKLAVCEPEIQCTRLRVQRWIKSDFCTVQHPVFDTAQNGVYFTHARPVHLKINSIYVGNRKYSTERERVGERGGVTEAVGEREEVGEREREKGER